MMHNNIHTSDREYSVTPCTNSFLPFMLKLRIPIGISVRMRRVQFNKSLLQLTCDDGYITRVSVYVRISTGMNIAKTSIKLFRFLQQLDILGCYKVPWLT